MDRHTYWDIANTLLEENNVECSDRKVMIAMMLRMVERIAAGTALVLQQELGIEDTAADHFDAGEDKRTPGERRWRTL